MRKNLPSGNGFFNKTPFRTEFVIVSVQSLKLFLSPLSEEKGRILEVGPSLSYLKFGTIITFFFENFRDFFPLFGRESRMKFL